LANLLATCDEIWIPPVVLAKIKAGFYGGGQRHRNEALLQALLAKPTVGLLLLGRETALWIATLALEHDLPLITRDRRFDCVPQLMRG
jgi:predicted nucleic acid-binding protein